MISRVVAVPVVANVATLPRQPGNFRLRSIIATCTLAAAAAAAATLAITFPALLANGTVTIATASGTFVFTFAAADPANGTIWIDSTAIVSGDDMATAFAAAAVVGGFTGVAVLATVTMTSTLSGASAFLSGTTGVAGAFFATPNPDFGAAASAGSSALTLTITHGIVAVIANISAVGNSTTISSTMVGMFGVNLGPSEVRRSLSTVRVQNRIPDIVLGADDAVTLTAVDQDAAALTPSDVWAVVDDEDEE